MATSTIESIVARTRRHLRLHGQLMWTPPDMELEVYLACRELALKIMPNPELRSELTKTYDITFGTGEAAPLSSFTELLIESCRNARVFVTGYANPFSWFPTRQDLERGATPPATAGRYTIEGQYLVARGNPAVPNTTTGTIIAMFIPVIAATAGSTTLPDRLIPHMVEVLSERLTGGPAQEQG